MSLSIAASLKDFAFDNLLFGAIKVEKLNDGEGTEHDPLEGTSFQPINIHPSGTSSSHSPAISYTLPTPSASSVPTLRSQSLSPSPASMARDVDIDNSDFGSPSDADDSAPATGKRKRKSKSKIGYQKLTFKKRRAADRQRKKDTLNPDFNVTPSLRERHVASATPISIPIFSLDTKVPAKTGYIGVRDAKASKKVYKLGELVGETSRFNFNLIEWDGKFVHFLCLIALASLHDTEYPVQL
jgi:hypothetical protein